MRVTPHVCRPQKVSRALRRERRRRNQRNDVPLVACNSHHNAPMTAELAVALALAAAKRRCQGHDTGARETSKTRDERFPPRVVVGTRVEERLRMDTL